MIERNDNRVWLCLPNGTYYLMGEGITSLRERCETVLLETPRINRSVCEQEILYHVPRLEFEGYRTPSDPANEYLVNRYLKRGNDTLVTLIIGNRNDKQVGQTMKARRVTGHVCIENPGSGEGPFGSRIKGSIVYASQPEEGVYYEDQQIFIPYQS